MTTHRGLDPMSEAVACGAADDEPMTFIAERVTCDRCASLEDVA